MARLPFDPATDYYRLLGVNPGAPVAEIQAAYRRLAKAYHPDLNLGSSVAHARMARINQAKAILLNPSVRAEYDRARADRMRPRAGVVPNSHWASAAAATAPFRPPAAVARSAPRAVFRPAAERAARPTGGMDRATMLLAILVLPLVIALAVYVVGAIQVSARTPQTAGIMPDLALAPSDRPDPHVVASQVLAAISGRPRSLRTAGVAARLIHSLYDGSPETSTLRSAEYRLYLAARDGDQAQWDSAVGDICTIAGAECGASSPSQSP